MSKSLGNITAPEEVIRESGADILRLWVASSDYREDLRIGKEIMKTHTDAYRKIRNTLRYLLGNLGDQKPERPHDLPMLERAILHRMAKLDLLVRDAYRQYDFAKAFHALFNFCTLDLSAVYFDIRKDALYCDAHDSNRRQACLYVLDQLFEMTTRWLAPILPFTSEEAFMSRHGTDACIHLETLPEPNAAWVDDGAEDVFAKMLQLRRVMLGALEQARDAQLIGGALDAQLIIHDPKGQCAELTKAIGLAELSITSHVHVLSEEAGVHAFRLDDVADIAVVVARADGERCERCWVTDTKVAPHQVAPLEETAKICPRCLAAIS